MNQEEEKHLSSGTFPELIFFKYKRKSIDQMSKHQRKCCAEKFELFFIFLGTSQFWQLRTWIHDNLCWQSRVTAFAILAMFSNTRGNQLIKCQNINKKCCTKKIMILRIHTDGPTAAQMLSDVNASRGGDFKTKENEQGSITPILV